MSKRRWSSFQRSLVALVNLDVFPVVFADLPMANRDAGGNDGSRVLAVDVDLVDYHCVDGRVEL